MYHLDGFYTEVFSTACFRVCFRVFSARSRDFFSLFDNQYNIFFCPKMASILSSLAILTGVLSTSILFGPYS